MTRSQVEAVIAKLGWTEVPDYMEFLITGGEDLIHKTGDWGLELQAILDESPISLPSVPTLADLIDEEWPW